jgi:hypothetical protein
MACEFTCYVFQPDLEWVASHICRSRGSLSVKLNGRDASGVFEL